MARATKTKRVSYTPGCPRIDDKREVKGVVP